ncbi:MAG: TonB family protein [Gammaproteobacteria bacterium]|nr:TonB family protein [Gammaproteobacteria bacterium]MBU2181554.1 TonB family protein [Gammaproteobacteria bacterium]MBU2204868.1 TonB family protein [Gammaproteobacteria bacterium]
MKKWLLLALLGSSVAQANMLDALQAYGKKDYAAAAQQFAELLPLGNELAAFNLGVMAYQGEGQPADLAKALAYFMLAADLEHDESRELLQRLTAKATEQQLDTANSAFEQLKQLVIITETDLSARQRQNTPDPIRRVHPEYPIDAAKNGQFGYVKLRFLVNEDGDVTTVDTLDAFPAKVFERASVKAVKRWKYQPSDKKHLFEVQLDYSLQGKVDKHALARVLEKNKLWQYAAAGAPQYQFALGTLLTLMEVQSPNSFWFDPELPLIPEPDFSIYRKRNKLTADLDGFWGYAVVRVAADGTITEQLKVNFESKNQLSSLVGQKLSGEVDNEVYRLSRSSSNPMKKLHITPSVTASRAMSGKFWWQQAAKNGDLDAQRVMAAYDPQWEQYLLAQQDGEVMAWAGTRMFLNGQQAQGIVLLEKAIAKNYSLAEEMRLQLDRRDIDDVKTRDNKDVTTKGR